MHKAPTDGTPNPSHNQVNISPLDTMVDKEFDGGNS